MSDDTRKVVLEREGPLARIWLNRPRVHNAFDAELMAQLAEAVDAANADAAVRVIVLGGRGRSFSAGADLSWMKAAAEVDAQANLDDAGGLSTMLRALDNSPKATVARIQGTALGGGLGLIACCDIALAVERAKFGFSEVKLGLIPAVISPFVIDKIGPGHARHLFVSGHRFDATAAERIGLVTRVLSDEEQLDAALAETVEQLLTSAPEAVAAAKALVRTVVATPAAEVDAYTTRQIAERRVSAEAQEGIKAFLEKRKPAWHPAARSGARSG